MTIQEEKTGKLALRLKTIGQLSPVNGNELSIYMMWVILSKPYRVAWLIQLAYHPDMTRRSLEVEAIRRSQ